MAQLNEELIPVDEPIPVGDYKACLIEIGDKENPQRAFTVAGNGSGEYLRTVFEIVDGQHKGRKVFENLQLKRYGNADKDRTTEKIARGKLSRMCKAYGIVGSLKDTNQLLNKPPVMISLKIKEAFGNRGPDNEITNWKSLVPQAQQQYQQPSAPPTQPDPFTPAGNTTEKSQWSQTEPAPTNAQQAAQQPPWGQNNQQQGGW